MKREGEERTGEGQRRGEERKECHLLYFVREVISGLIYLLPY